MRNINNMTSIKRTTVIPMPTAAALCVAAISESSIAQTGQGVMGMPSDRDTVSAEISRAMSAGPPDVARGATIAQMDKAGHLTIIRAGTNGFTCMPGDPNDVGMPAMCVDKPSLQWFTDF